MAKDFSSNGLLFRNLAGRFLVWREARAYRALEGIRGIPRLFRVIDGLALVMERVEGRDLEEIRADEEIPSGFFEDLKDLVEEVHRRGFAHCDLKRAPNTLMGADGRPYVVDWSASISQKEFPFFPLNRVFLRFARDDLNAIVKMRLRHCPWTVSEEERSAYARRGRGERFIRALRDALRALLQRIA